MQTRTENTFVSITDQLNQVHGGQSVGGAAALDDLKNLGYPIKNAMILDANDPKFGPQTAARCLSARAINPTAPDTLYCMPNSR
jgi:hypothetical protein